MNLVCDCGFVIGKFDVWILKDIKDFEARKLFVGLCPHHHKPVVSIYEKRISDGIVFKKENLVGNSAMKVINNEAKNLLHKLPKVNTVSLKGWVYGINKQFKNKDGSAVVKQYSSDFYGHKNLVKIIN